jgi:hypothetical protein
MKIALCFRGIARSLQHTVESIRSHIIEPAEQFGDVRIFTHLFDQTTIDNPRSGEQGPLDRSEYLLLQSHEIKLEDPDECLSQHGFDALKTYGDPWNNNFTSLKNLIHELHSLKEGWKMAELWNPSITLFLRPDLLYASSFRHLFNEIQLSRRKGLCLPVWQGCWGANDRFAIATTHEAAIVYAERIDYVMDYCSTTRKPLHAEKFLLHQLRQNKTPLWFTRLQARRIRMGGDHAPEKFSTLKGSNVPAWIHGLKTGFGKRYLKNPQ